MPDGAERGLIALVTSYDERWLLPETAPPKGSSKTASQQFLDEFNGAMDAHSRSCQENLEKAEALRKKIAELECHKRTLSSYLELLDTLEPGSGETVG